MKNISVPTNLAAISSFEQLLPYLEANLDWPTKQYSFEDLTFEFEPEELGLKDADAAKIKSIHQLRPLKASQPFGIFFVEFENKKLPVVVLRRILSHLALKKRASANKTATPAWHAQDIIFVSAFGEDNTAQRELAFAHFHQTDGDLPTLRVLGWDGADTKLKLDQVDKDLRTCLHWPDDESDTAQWRAKWTAAFKHRQGYVIRTANELAQTLALFARQIRDAAVTMLEAESERGAFRKLYKGFKTALIHDLTEEAFADTYAQTITYGLLTAAISRTDKVGEEGTALVADNIADMVPVTNPFLKDMLETFLHAGGRKGGINFDELGIQDVVDLLRDREKTDLAAVLRDFNNKTQGEDPVIHFYEHFLSAYNKKLKIQRGVFYTPQPVVSYIVRSVHELLQAEFGLEDGLASTVTWGEMIKRNPHLKLPDLSDDPKYPKPLPESEYFVQILDPATGTATFLVEAIDVIYTHLKAKWAESGLDAMPKLPTDTANPGLRSLGEGGCKLFTDFWNAYVPKALLPRLHGYELMMAPYAIAHMKIGLKLHETGYRFGTEERARIYLTNALEPKVTQISHIAIEALAHEALAVNEIKWNKRFTVVIGNPPYSNFGMLNKIPFILDLLDEYKRDLEEKKLNLDDDFIKFIRFSQWQISRSSIGVAGLITNNTYIDGITHRQMRLSLINDFDSIHIMDLHGSSLKKETCRDGSKDENVFDIQQGVGISFLTKKSASQRKMLAHADVRGTRDAKYRLLNEAGLTSTIWCTLNAEPSYYFFVPKDFRLINEYSRYSSLVDMFTINGPGVKTERDGVSVHWTKKEIEDAVNAFRELSENELRIRFQLGEDSRDWKIANAKVDVLKNQTCNNFKRILYRPFDYRQTWYSGKTRGFIGTPGYPVMKNMLDSKALGLLAMRQFEYDVPDYCYFFVTPTLTECRVFVSNRGIANLFPLYLTNEAEDVQQTLLINQRKTNLQTDFLKLLAERLRLKCDTDEGLPQGLTPEDIFYFAYAIFHSPGYRARYAEFLKIDFPRLPLTSSLDLFRSLAALGGELVALHLMESPKLDNPITHWIGEQKQEVEKVTYSDETVWIDKAKSTGFKGVPENVWNFHIGGYQVCEKWLKDRKGRTLTDDDITHYQKIIVALSETIRLMSEIDTVITTYGGWPGAFAERKEQG